MPLSNTTQDILRGSPYWDDFDAEKRFHRILIKPKTPVQTRELNQMQTILQNQIEQVTSSVYREGAAVNGGQQSFANNTVVLQVVRSDNIDINNFYDAENASGAIIEGQSSGARAIVTQVSSQSVNSNYAAILFMPLNAIPFIGGETASFINANTGGFIAEMSTATGTDVTSVASTFSVAPGTFYLRGHLVQVPKQTAILEVGSQLPSKRVGFTVTESIVNNTQDTTLLDPALGSTNYAAPGADRLKLSAVLVARDINDDTITPNSDVNFIELVRIIDGVIQPHPDRLQSDFIEDTLARRTNDESGDYVVRPFRLLVKDHNPPVGVPNITGRVTVPSACTVVQAANTLTSLILANGVTTNVTTLFATEIAVGDILVVNGERREITAIANNTQLTVNAAFTVPFTNSIATVISANKVNLEIERGKAYVRGYEIETTGTLKLAANRARTTQNVNNGKVATEYGPYLIVNRFANTSVSDSNGSFNTQTLELVDLHSVPLVNVIASATGAGAGVYFGSKIGTARTRSFTYHSGDGGTSTAYRLYLVDAVFETKTFQVDNTNASNNTALTGNSSANSVTTNVTSKTIRLRENASASAGGILPQGNNAFVGATIKLYTSDGGQVAYSVLASNSSGNSTTLRDHTLLLDADDRLSYVNVTANVQVVFSDKCIRSVTSYNGTTCATPVISSGATTDILSTVGYTKTGNTVMFGTTNVPLLFRYREGLVKANTINDHAFEVMRYAGSITGVAPTVGNTTHSQFTISRAGSHFTNDERVWNLISTSPFEYLIATVATTGKPIPLSLASVTAGDIVIDTSNPAAFVLTIKNTVAVGSFSTGDAVKFYVRTIVESSTEGSPAWPRTKTLCLANTSLANVAILTSNLVTDVATTSVATYRGHIGINQITTTSPRIVSLGISDVARVQKIYAVVDPDDTNTWIDVTNNYTVDLGQRSWCYDHASITLKPGAVHYTSDDCNQLLVMVDRYKHSTATGALSYFNPRSYADRDYEEIPTFTDPKTGETYALAEYVDFRPVRSDDLVSANTATNPYTNAAAYTFASTALPHPSAIYSADYEYYLPRVDKVVLTKDRQFRIISGVPSSDPQIPADDPEGITLYVLSYPAYTALPEVVNVQPLEYRRYTMKDIGKLERRIESLEYYSALSLMDLQSLNNPELDEFDSERFKNGIVTDDFSNDGTVDHLNPDTKISLDQKNREMRPLALTETFSLEPDPNVSNSNNVVPFGTGRMISLPYTDTPFLTQGLASKSININPFNVFSWNGTLSLYPSSDTWIDTITRPDLVVNLFNENDGIVEGVSTISTHFDFWTDVVVGAPQSVTTTEEERGKWIPDPWGQQALGRVRDQRRNTTRTTTSQTTRTTQWQRAIETKRKVSFIEDDLGERVIDSSIASKMRGRNVDIVAKGLLPGATLRGIFDGVDVTSYIERANRITIAYNDAALFKVGDQIQAVLNEADAGSARVVSIVTDAENDAAYLYVVDAVGLFTGTVIESRQNPTLLEDETTIAVTVVAYQHYHGWVTAVTKPSTAWTITLDAGASTTVDSYSGKVIHFTDGGALRRVNLFTNIDATATSGLAGLTAQITSYEPSTRVATLGSVSAALDTALTAQQSSLTTWNPIRYSIGSPQATQSGTTNTPAISPGSFFGLFRLPGLKYTTPLDAGDALRYQQVASSALQFNVGTRVFQLINDNEVNTPTSAQTTYVAQGSTTIKQKNVVRTRQLETIVESLSPTLRPGTQPNESTFSVTTTDSTGLISYIDPLSQTFIVSQNDYPDGIFITHVDLFFAKKGVSGLDVTLQLRATDNGFPSADVILGSTFVTADQIKIVPVGVMPLPGNSQHYTRFTFETPVYLAPNEEYAITVLSNSNEYELFVGEIGQKQIGSDKIISQQPHGGVLFKSQNARTWTPEPLEDLMFVLHRAQFEKKQGALSFNIKSPDNSPYATLINNTQFDAAYVNLDYLDWIPTREYTEFALLTRTVDNSVTTNIVPLRQNVIMPERMYVTTDTPGSLRLRTTLRTTSDAVAPIYDADRANVILVKNLIDNGRLYSNGVMFTPGVPSGAPLVSGTIALTVSGGNGNGAVMTAATNSTGYVTGITVSNGGFGYTETPAIANTADITSYYSVAPTFTYTGETSAASAIVGEEKSRYITRIVNLSDGFDAGDLKVYLSAIRGPQHNIDVYYKVMATGDSARFEDKTWTLMHLRDDLQNVFSSRDTERKEYEYRTQANTASYTANGVTFDRFHTFAIKVVLRSQDQNNDNLSKADTVRVPRVANLRVLALDE